MNTQTHLLLGLAVFARRPRESGAPSSSAALEAALLFGALVPDASLFLMWGQARLAGVPDERIWSELYYSGFWQGIGALSNSLLVFALLALAARSLGGRFVGEAVRVHRAASIVLAFAAAALLHVVTDLPLHHDDGHPHFWPLSDWIYASPVSYWDPAHHGTAWSLIEAALAALLIVLLWRRSRAWWAKALLALAGLSYAGVVAYFTAALG